MTFDPFSSIAIGDSILGASGLIDYNVAVTPHDVTPNVLDKDGKETIAVAVWVEAEGVVVYIDRHGNTRSIKVPAMTWVPILIKQIKSTGTTATGISVGIAPL